jgi:hypothetical protein
VNNIYDLIEMIKRRPAMYIGDSKISTINTFLHGYCFATEIYKVECPAEFPPFWYFHEWAMDQYNWYESTAGWKNIILKENDNDEERSLQVFFQFIDEFKKLHPIGIEKAILKSGNLAFHHSDNCKIKYGDGKPVYENANEVMLVRFSHDFGVSVFVVKDSKVVGSEWTTRFDTPKEAKLRVERLFSDVEWNEQNGDLTEMLRTAL